MHKEPKYISRKRKGKKKKKEIRKLSSEVDTKTSSPMENKS